MFHSQPDVDLSRSIHFRAYANLPRCEDKRIEGFSDYRNYQSQHVFLQAFDGKSGHPDSAPGRCSRGILPFGTKNIPWKQSRFPPIHPPRDDYCTVTWTLS